MEIHDDGHTEKVTFNDTGPITTGDIELTIRLKIRNLERMFKSQSLVDLVAMGYEANPDWEITDGTADAYDAAMNDLVGFTRQLLGELAHGLEIGGHAIAHRN